MIAFRLVTDSSVSQDGLWVDDVAIDGTVLSDGSTLDGWQSPTQFNPIDVDGYTLRLVAYTDDHSRAWTHVVRLGAGFRGVIEGDALDQAIGRRADVVAAIVTYHDKTETVQQYAPYTLRVDGVLHAGGRELTPGKHQAAKGAARSGSPLSCVGRCPGWDSNPHASFEAGAFKAPSSTGSDTRAGTLMLTAIVQKGYRLQGS